MLITTAFKRLHYPIDVIAQCVRWYLAYSLSLRNLEEMMSERGVNVDHSTVHRWILRITPILNKTAARYKKTVNQFWHIDETYIKIKGQWHYLYRAIDSDNKTVDFLLTKRRDMQAARRFFKNAISKHACPIKVTIDKTDRTRPSIYQKKVRPMLGFKSFRSAKIILSGIELMHMLRKKQFNVSKEFQDTLGLLCPKNG